MKKLLFLTSTLLFSFGLMCGCGSDDDDVRDNYVGNYEGTRSMSVTTINSTQDNDNPCTMRVKKNESNKKSIVVMPSTSNDILFYTENMEVVKIDGQDAYCGTIKSEITEDPEDGTSTTKEGENISENIPYSCAILKTPEGKYILQYSYKTVNTTTHNTQIITTDSFTGVK